MANVVAGFGVPHTPVFPFFVKRDGPDCETAKLFAAQKEQLAAVRPDVIVMFDTDHLNTFFLDNLPIFAVGRGQELYRSERRAAGNAGVQDPFSRRSGGAYPADRRGSGLRRRPDPAFFGRSFDCRAAALSHAGHAGAGRTVLHQRTRAAAAVGAALLCARSSRRPRHRVMAGTAARRGHGQRQLLTRSRRPAHGAGPHRRRARSGLGLARSSS